MIVIDAAVDVERCRRRLTVAGLAGVVELVEVERIWASQRAKRKASVGVRVLADVIAAGLGATDRAEIEGLLVEALTVDDDEAAWRPLMRARKLVERAAIVAGRR